MSYKYKTLNNKNSIYKIQKNEFLQFQFDNYSFELFLYKFMQRLFYFERQMP